MSQLPQDINTFLVEIIQHYAHGHRDEQFALWAATKASFLLEYRDLLIEALAS